MPITATSAAMPMAMPIAVSVVRSTRVRTPMSATAGTSLRRSRLRARRAGVDSSAKFSVIPGLRCP
jgi:hypothetical protein